MSNATKAAIMDPNDLGTLAGVGGFGAVGAAFLMKLYNQYLTTRTDSATSQATVNMLNELQEDNKELRVENNRLRDDNSRLMHEKFTFESKLNSALEKMQFMTNQMEEMRAEVVSLRDTIRRMSNEHRT